VPFARELDAEAVKRSKLYVDRKESVLNEGGDFLLAKKEGGIDDSHIIGELGDLALGKVAGRQSDEEITLFKSLGLAVEDLASANHIYERAVDSGIGTFVELGGEREND
jgi:ornithine cyclodeaminase